MKNLPAFRFTTPPGSQTKYPEGGMYATKKRMFSRFLGGAIALVLIFVVSAFTVETTPVQRTDQKFSEIVYTRPDEKEILAKMEEASAMTQTDLLPLSLFKTMGEISDLTRNFYSSFAIADIHSRLDVTDPFFSAEMEALTSADNRIQSRYNQLYDEIFASKFGNTFQGAMGEASVEDQEMQSQVTAPALFDLQDEEQRLTDEYHNQISQATVLVDGQEEAYSSLSLEEQDEYLQEYYEKYNPIFGELFRELVAIRADMAEELGFDSYTQVADLQMARVTYTREEIQAFRQDLKTWIAPLYRSYQEDFYRRAESDSGMVYLLDGPSPNTAGGWENNFETLGQVFNSMSEETANCFNYMADHEFFDVAPSAQKANMAFTTSIYNLNTPFLFANFNGTGEDVQSFCHEFGHSFATYRQQELGSDSEGRGLDVCEIHSQAMEMLTIPFLDRFYGNQAKTAGKYSVYNLLAGVLSTAAYDEFQEEVYAAPEQTLEEINSLFGRLLSDYGLIVGNKFFGPEEDAMLWFTVSHFYDVPFYSIDYALSGCAALEFLELMDEDYDKALATYFSLVEQSPEDDFLTVLEKAGLPNPFKGETLQALAESVGKVLEA